MYKAIKTFAGIKIAMKKGDIVENIEKEIAEDLLRAGYIEEIKEEVEPVVEESTCAEIAQVQEEVVEETEEIKETKEVEKPKRTTTKRNKVQK